MSEPPSDFEPSLEPERARAELLDSIARVRSLFTRWETLLLAAALFGPAVSRVAKAPRAKPAVTHVRGRPSESSPRADSSRPDGSSRSDGPPRPEG